MPFLVWNDLFSVGYDEIDRQHQNLFLIANEYHDAFTHVAGRNVLAPVFQKLIGYTKYHFTDEERIMERCKYPDLARHHTNHEKLLNLVMSYKRQFDEGVPGVDVACMEFLKMWLNAHILGLDKQYMPYVANPAAAEGLRI